MKQLVLACFFWVFWHPVKAQSLYFPPLVGNQWDTISPQQMGWCLPELDSLNQFLLPHTKAFIILKDGKIAVEWYFGTFTRDSLWYWASAGKTVAAFLTGMAQQQQLLTLSDTVSKFLGSGYTSASPQQEAAIRVHHLLSMTSGLNDLVIDDNCTTPACLQYLAPAGTRWAYYNAPYRLLHDVIAAAAQQSFQQYFNQQLSLRTGVVGFWSDKVLFSRARSMARFGLLMLAKGRWQSDTLLTDTSFFNQQVQASQNINQAYGYLWWLNSSNSFMLPSTQISFSGRIIPNAPTDLWSGLGKNDQKLYVVPSQNIVIVRMGDAAGGISPTLSSFDNQLWHYLNRVFCVSTHVPTPQVASTQMLPFPNPVIDCFRILNVEPGTPYTLYDAWGKQQRHGEYVDNICIQNLPSGVYWLKLSLAQNLRLLKIIKL